MVNYPSKMIRDGYDDQKVVNFDISENVTIFELDNGQYWWSGGNIAYTPEPIKVQDPNIKLFAAGDKSYVLVSS